MHFLRFPASLRPLLDFRRPWPRKYVDASDIVSLAVALFWRPEDFRRNDWISVSGWIEDVNGCVSKGGLSLHRPPIQTESSILDKSSEGPCRALRCCGKASPLPR